MEERQELGSSLQLGRIFGIPIWVNYTWFIIFALVTFSLSSHYFPQNYPGWPSGLYWAVGLVTSLLFFGSVIAHELSHSLVARANGVPVSSITLFIFGGVAQIASEATRPRDELIMALAGPLASIAVAVACGAIWLVTNAIAEPLAALMSWLGIINVSLAAFNLIPGFPLDGGRALRAILWMTTGDFRKATRAASTAGVAIAYLFIVGGLWVAFTSSLADGLWIAFIGWFLENAAQNSLRQMALQEALRGVKVRDVMSSDCLQVPPSVSVEDLVDSYVLPTGRRCFVISDGDQLLGLVTLHNVKVLPRERWSLTKVSDIMSPVDRLKVAGPRDDVAGVLPRMDQEDVNQLPVVDNGRFLGLIARDSLLRLIRVRSELRV